MQRFCSRFTSSGMLRCVVGWTDPGVSWDLIGLLDPEEGGTMALRNLYNHSSSNTVKHPKYTPAFRGISLDCWTLKKAVLWPSEISITIRPAIQSNTPKDLAINVQEVTTLYVRNLSDKVCGNVKALAGGREAIMDLPNRRMLRKSPDSCGSTFLASVPRYSKERCFIWI